MSVPVSKRGKSKLEFFHQAYKLNDEITKLLLRDFGLKTINSDLNVFTYRAKMSDGDKQIFTDLANRYHLNVETAYPYWLIDYYRNWILHIDKEFIFLKTIYKMRPDGRIIKRITKDNINRERRKIYKLRKLVDDGKITIEHATDCYKSWRGSYKNYDSHYEILKMDRFFLSNFPEVNEKCLKKK